MNRQRPERNSVASAWPGQPLHVLLVDDDLLIRRGTAEMLSAAGHAVTEARSGEEALAILAGDSSIALLITDNRMPGMTGAMLISHVQDNAPLLPILLITGYENRGPDIAADVALLTKPFREAALLAAVRALVHPPHMVEAVKGITTRP